MQNIHLEEIKKLYYELKAFEENKIPLCAAENYTSPFVKQAYASVFDGKYSMYNLNWKQNDDFIGGKYINQLFQLVSDITAELFNSRYTDARTLSGMNCFAITASSILKKGEPILITSPSQGGHPSVPLILSNLGIPYEDIPYDYEKFQINYNLLNKMLQTNNYKAIVFCQSDLLTPPDFSKIDLKNQDLKIIYDATQTFGLILSKLLFNPLNLKNEVIMIGGTHKTLPGPTCGLIMTNNLNLGEYIDKIISPQWLRNVQPNMIAALLLALIEQKEVGYEYQKHIVELSNILGDKLESNGFSVAKTESGTYSYTHQIFLMEGVNRTERIFNNCVKYNITLNKKNKLLFNGQGLRVGTQEIARYNWNDNDCKVLADILLELSQEKCNEQKINLLLNQIKTKKQAYFVL